MKYQMTFELDSDLVIDDLLLRDMAREMMNGARSSLDKTSMYRVGVTVRFSGLAVQEAKWKQLGI